MEKLVLELVQVASSTAHKQALEDRCVRALSKLYSIPVSSEFLATSIAGHEISTLKSNPHLQQVIRDYASRLLTKWMRQLYSNSENPITVSPKPYSKTSESKNKPPNKVSESKTKTCSLPKLKKNVVSKESGRSTTAHCNDDGPLRSSIRQQVFEALKMASNESHLLKSRDPIGVSYSVESTLYNKWGLSNSINKQKYRSFLYNLKDPTNRDLRRMILMGEIQAGRITELKPEDMASTVRKNLNYSIKQSALKKCVVGRST